MPWIKIPERNFLKPVERAFYKLVDTKTPHLKKLILRVVALRTGARNFTGVFLVRDGFIVKPCNHSHKKFFSHLYLLGYKAPIGAKNIGELFKKYKIPKTTRAIVMGHRDINLSCRCFRAVMDLLYNSVECANAVITQRSDRYFITKNVLLTKVCGRLAKSKKVELLSSWLLRDTCMAYQRVEFVAPEMLEAFDWTQTIEEIHDGLSRISNRLKDTKRNIPIPYIEKTVEDIEKANEKLKGAFTLKLAINGNELLDWGEHLNHCIGGYTEYALKGAAIEKPILLGVFEPEFSMPTWTISMQRVSTYWFIQQFYGAYNTPPSAEIRGVVQTALGGV
jgi:hypothetical protein